MIGIRTHYAPKTNVYQFSQGNLSTSLDKLKRHIIEEERMNNYGYLSAEMRTSIEDKIEFLKSNVKQVDHNEELRLKKIVDSVTFPGNDITTMYLAMGKVEKALIKK